MINTWDVTIAHSCGIPLHGAPEGDDVARSRQVARRTARWHVLEDGSVDEALSSKVDVDDVPADLAEDAFALTLEHAKLAEVEALPPRRRACVVAGLARLGSLALQNVSASNKTGGDAAAVLLLVPEIVKCARAVIVYPVWSTPVDVGVTIPNRICLTVAFAFLSGWIRNKHLILIILNKRSHCSNPIYLMYPDGYNCFLTEVR